MLPLNVVFVRHGESEWNLAHEQDKAGDSTMMRRLAQRTPDDPELTLSGESHAIVAGDWLRRCGVIFDEYWTSPLCRAKETAFLLGYSKELWQCKQHLEERRWGDAAYICKEDKDTPGNAELFAWKEQDPFSWKPNKGESLTEALVRVDRIITDLRNIESDKSVICVNHGEFISLLRMRLESWSKEKYVAQSNSYGTKEWIRNGHILWYSRVNPWSREVTSSLKWVYSVCPWDLNMSYDCWQEI